MGPPLGFGGTELVAEPVLVNETPLIYSKAATDQNIDDIRAIAAGEAPLSEGDSSSDDSKEE